ncbi:hypothetical protein [Komagataeibacter kakiaceti]|uniref:hypothetical protein n=1 Tax=Komagataeibacter kakiaceti TaxID=943261 RepID=UPI0011DDD159|nr:hypothetical protein [Komagataeibacter kakiaceti]
MPYSKGPVRLFMADNWTLNRIRTTEVPEIINALQVAGLHERAILFQAVARGEIAMLGADNRGKMPLKDLRACGVPSITFLSANEPGKERPQDFDDLRRILAWARFVVIHAQHERSSDYEAILNLTRDCGRLLLIETSLPHITMWLERLSYSKKLMPFMLMAPENGEEQPIVETMH